MWWPAIVLIFTIGAPGIARAQAPASGPLILQLPATPRTAALGNAWVAGRDQDVLFYDPAQLINARQGLDASFFHYGADGRRATFGGIYAGGKLSFTLGWGVQYASFKVDPDTTAPLTTDALFQTGSIPASSALIAVGGAVLYKGFRIGAAVKYAADHVSAPASTGAPEARQSVMLADFGVSRNLVGGVGALAVQNLGPAFVDDAETIRVPRQVLLGWSTTHAAGPLDLGLYSQLALRHGWTAPGGGLEIGYSWIEGYNIAFRVGARRPETETERACALGAAFTADRITVEYSVQLFDGGRAAHGVTVRWR